VAWLLAGLPVSVPGVTVNRLCASSMEAVAAAARGIIAGEISLAIAGGVERMSRSPWVMRKPAAAFDRDPEICDTTLGWRFVNPLMEQKYGAISMAETAENVAEKYHIDRASQDCFALGSQQKTARAKAAGVFAEEIEPVALPGKKGSAASAAVSNGVISDDEHPRPDTTLEALSRLPTPFRKGGTVTAGNASGINDGAIAMFVASEPAAARFGLTPIARFVGASAAGVDPNYMGIGPIPAVQKLLTRLNMQIDDVDFLELNEAFAAQALACTRAFGLPDDSEKVNPNGGAIALGHPLGMSGGRLILTAAMNLSRTGARRAIASMCVGVGQGMAVLLERA
jgi:acetyl-CoA acyltransferase